MKSAWKDVSIPMHNGMICWPGDAPFAFAPAARIADGASHNGSTLALSTHTGTHVDAPWHFEDDGKRLHEVDTDLFFGEARVIDLPDVDLIRAEHLTGTSLGSRVLFKTRHSNQPITDPFDTNFVALHDDAAQRLVEYGVRLVGVDYMSVAPYKQKGQPTHHILLQNEVLIVEGLRLAGVGEGPCDFVVLPLPLQDADGAPCRAFLRERDRE